MASESQGWGGLLVVGTVLVLAAITIKVGFRDSTPDSEADQVSEAREAEGNARSASDLRAQGDNKMTAAKTTIAHADDADFQERVLDAQGRVLVDFYADWCGPCRMVAPVLEEIAGEVPGAQIVKVNVDHSSRVAAHYNIEAIPALLVFENGRVVDQHVGVANKAKMKRMLGL